MRTTFRTIFPAVLLACLISCEKENMKPNSLSVQSSQNEKATTAFHIGQSFGGGIIFFIDGSGQHGMIAAKQDLSTNVAWYNGVYKVTGATGAALGTGAANTRKIVNALGNSGNYAALLCSNFKSGGFSDWYLPSKAELNQLFKQRSKVGGFSGSNYWSSTEASSTNAWDQEFGGGFKFSDDKGFTILVRPVRSF